MTRLSKMANDKVEFRQERQGVEGKVTLCVGLVCVDIISVCKQYPIEDSGQKCLKQAWHRGGNASNSCTVLSLLGAPCEYLGTMTKTFEAEFLKEDFKKNGINIDHCVYHEDCTCPLSVAIINQTNGSRTILHSNRNLPEMTFKDFSQLDLSKYKWIHFEGRPAEPEIRQMLDHIDSYNRALPQGQQRIITSVELEKTRIELVDLFGRADYLFVSKENAHFLGCKTKEEAAEKLISKCREGATLIVPWGDQGAIATTTSGETFTIPAFPPEKMLDTLGAGDTFNAATILSLGQGESLRSAVEFGCRVAGAKCGMYGFQDLRGTFLRR